MKQKKSFLCLLLVIVISISVIPMEVSAEESKFNQWLLSGADYDEDEQSYILTKDNTTWTNGSIWCDTAYYEDFTLELDYYTGVSDRPLGGADGIAIAFYANFDYKKGFGEEMGFNGSGGYGIELDTYKNISQNDPDYNHISLIKERGGNHLITERLDESEDGMWHHLKVEVKDYICFVYVDENLKFTYAVEPTDYGFIGITSATGAGTNKHAVKNISITGKTNYEKQLLELTLNHELIDSSYKKDGSDEEYYEYKISAKIKNGMTVTAKDSSLMLEMEGTYVEISSETPENVSIGDLEPENEIVKEWIVYIPKTEQNVSIEYSVTLDIENIVKLEQLGRILLESKNEKDNSIIFGQDQWRFSNSDYYFNNSEKNESYYLTEEDHEAVTAGLSNRDKFIIAEEINDNWGGSCYGMSATTVLAKMGVINASYIQEGKESLYEIEKINNDDVESLINFYYLQQLLDPAVSNCREFLKLNTVERLNIIEELASSVTRGGTPFILSFKGSEGAHAVVAYGVEHGTFQGGYDSRILIYDCNFPEKSEQSYLYYNHGTDEWTIPNYPWANVLKRALADITIIDTINHKVETSNSVARIRAKGQLKFYMYQEERIKEITSETYIPNEGIFSVFDDGVVLDEEGNLIPTDSMTVILPSLTESYRLKPANENAPCNFDMIYENICLSAVSDKAEEIVFEPEGKVSVEGNEGEYALTVCANEGYYNLPWYEFTVSGSDSSEISLEQTEEGVLVKGSNLKDVIVVAKNREETKNITFSTEQPEVLIGSDAMNSTKMPVVKIDKDSNGTYETALVGIDNILLNKKHLMLTKGSSESLQVIVTPSDAVTPKMIWNSSDDNIAVVDQNGLVTAKNIGTATITVKTEDEKFSTSCKVSVVEDTTVEEQDKTEPTESGKSADSNQTDDSANQTKPKSQNDTVDEASRKENHGVVSIYLVFLCGSIGIIAAGVFYWKKKFYNK